MAKTEPLPGTSDIFPDETAKWQFIEEAVRTTFQRYGYGELRTPIFERTEVFLKSIGDETDIVQKEMYTFEDRGGRSLTLRPEGTASVMRALANGGIPQGEERKVFYIGPMFRGERPAAGRKRQFHQAGVENVGKIAPHIDVECIAMLDDFIKNLGISKTRMLVNSRGVLTERPQIAEKLHEYFSSYKHLMDEDNLRRLDTNVWRILDSKDEKFQEVILNAPRIDELLSDESRDYFKKVCEGLDVLGIDYEIDPRLVRGLDYYEHTVFELQFDGIGAQNALAGGGRYLIQPPGIKKPLPGVGFACGMERLMIALDELGVSYGEEPGTDAYLVSLGEEALKVNLKLAHQLRGEGLKVQMDLENRGMKAQLRTANKLNAKKCYILGDSELDQGIIVLKNMEDSTQTEIKIEDLLNKG
ncbi:MAG: histidine--tRNA ligase [Lentisphaeria bacterium]|nr:histidine--tRNA ligase [Lentisphaeria bacterium]